MIQDNYIYKLSKNDLSDLKTKIIKAAIEEFALRSIDGARTREITKKSGANLSAISYHFGGKENLYSVVIKELSEFFDYLVKDYYDEGKVIIKNNDAQSAKALIFKFLFNCLRKFAKSDVFSQILLILAREEVNPSASFEYIYESVYKKPIKFLGDLIFVSANGKFKKEYCMVFAHSLWANVRSYHPKNKPSLKLHNWKTFGDNQIKILEESLDIIVEKTLKQK